jgi:hypothetical protein
MNMAAIEMAISATNKQMTVLAILILGAIVGRLTSNSLELSLYCMYSM